MFGFVFACACNFNNNRVGKLHIKVFSDIHIRVGTLHMKKYSDDLTKTGTLHTYTRMWGHRTYFDDDRNNWGGDTIQHWRIKLKWLVGRVRSVLSKNITTPWLHLASWYFPDSQLSWESKMELSVAIVKTRNPNHTKTEHFWPESCYSYK